MSYPSIRLHPRKAPCDSCTVTYSWLWHLIYPDGESFTVCTDCLH